VIDYIGDDSDENDGDGWRLTGCSGSCRENRAAETSVTYWPSTTRSSQQPTSSTLSRKSSPVRVAEETASRRESVAQVTAGALASTRLASRQSRHAAFATDQYHTAIGRLLRPMLMIRRQSGVLLRVLHTLERLSEDLRCVYLYLRALQADFLMQRKRATPCVI